MRKTKLIAIIIIASVTAMCCASRPRTRSELIAATRNVKLPAYATENNALVYVMRPSNMYKNYPYEIFINNPTVQSNYAGSTRGGEYIFFYISPGNHRIYSFSDNGSWLDIEAEERINYFIEQNTSKGILRGFHTIRFIDIYNGKWNIKTLSQGKAAQKFHR